MMTDEEEMNNIVNIYYNTEDYNNLNNYYYYNIHKKEIEYNNLLKVLANDLLKKWGIK